MNVQARIERRRKKSTNHWLVQKKKGGKIKK
jgi:hypothetical protein